MSKSTPQLPIGILATKEDWIKHFVDMHKQMPGSPSPDDLRKYPAAMLKTMVDHDDLHRHFHTGHEHETTLSPLKMTVSMVMPGRTK